MSVRFVIGRAGSGKTYRCVQAIRERLNQDPIDGPRLLLLVPEQTALQMERAIVSPFFEARPTSRSESVRNPERFSSARGAHRALVLSFRRLAYLVLETVAVPAREALSEPARAMVLRHLVAEKSPGLRYYRRAALMPGLFDRLGATIAEMIEEGIDPNQLETVGAAVSESDPAQSAKLNDLRILYSAYLSYLGADRLDPSQFLQAARPYFDRSDLFRGAELWVDGFASLSGQETAALVELATLCSHAEITVMLDPRLATCEPGLSSDSAQLFLRIHRMYRRLHGALRRAGHTALETVLLETRPPPRFIKCASLARLERNLFAAPADAIGSVDDSSEGIELAALPSRRVEVDYAVSKVLDWVMGSRRACRYRDIALIARDLEPYHDLVIAALHSRGIPFFIDRRRAMGHHPLVELLRAGLAVAAEDLSMDSVRAILKTGLLPLNDNEADELENYVLAHGITGKTAWQQEWVFRDRSSFLESAGEPTEDEKVHHLRLNQSRERFLWALEPWFRNATGSTNPTGSEWFDLLIDWLGRIRANETLATWARTAERDGELYQAEEHRQVWRDVIAFLEDLATAFSTRTLPLEELQQVVEAGLSVLTLGLAPPMVDQVLVGSIDRSRHPDIRHAVVLGFNDAVFPQRSAEDSILNDDDRTLLMDAGLELRPPSRTKVLEERLLAYTAVTRAAESVVIAWPVADEEGRPLRPSPYVAAIRNAVPRLAVRLVEEPKGARHIWPILSTRDLARQATAEFRSRPPPGSDRLEVRAQWNELYSRYRETLNGDAAARFALSSLDERPGRKLSKPVIEKAFPKSLHTSVSQLESFAACPFQHFARYILKLKPRAIARMESVDIGQWHHAVLEELLRTVVARPQGWHGLSDSELLERLGESCTRVAAKLPQDGSISHARDAYILRRSSERLGRIIRSQRDAGQRGAYRPRAMELPFGFDDSGSLPPLSIRTPSGRQVFLRGFIDRVDLAELGDELLGMVVDYKHTRDKRLDLTRTFHGLSLQLLAYLLVLSENGETLAGRRIRPSAGLYLSLVPQYRLVRNPEEADGEEASMEEPIRPRGVIRWETIAALEADPTATGWSKHFSVYRKTDGNPGHLDRSDAAESSRFDPLLEHTRRKLGELADDLLDGDVAVRPYRLRSFSPCSWCELRSVCRFEIGLNEVRYLEAMKRSDVLDRIRP